MTAARLRLLAWLIAVMAFLAGCTSGMGSGQGVPGSAATSPGVAATVAPPAAG